VVVARASSAVGRRQAAAMTPVSMTRVIVRVESALMNWFPTTDNQ
jgi:hypothetical protein